MATLSHRLLLVCLLVLTSAAASAQEMVEVPTDPAQRQRIEERIEAERLRLAPPVPAPSASEPVPPPVVVPPPVGLSPPPPMPPTEHRLERRWDLLGLGLGLFGGAYTVNAAFGLGFRQWALTIPVAGPIVEMTRSQYPPLYIMLALDTVVQAGGIVVAVVAPFKRHWVWRPIDHR